MSHKNIKTLTTTWQPFLFKGILLTLRCKIETSLGFFYSFITQKEEKEKNIASDYVEKSKLLFFLLCSKLKEMKKNVKQKAVKCQDSVGNLY